MLSLSLLIATAILAFLPGFSSSCSPNEIESECINPCNTCEQKSQCEPPSVCQPGCDCKPGFFRDETGYCVPEQRCQRNNRCPKNAVFHSCAPLSLPSCENPYPEPDYESDCSPGCTCRPGYLKRKDGQCVTPGRCYPRDDRAREKQVPKCPKNAIFIKCGSPCPPTCEDRNPEPCEEKCITACYCKPGYLKRKDGVCVRPIDCQPHKKQDPPTPKCPENAIYIECGSACPPTCEDRLPVCKEKCTKACYCKPGYLLKTSEAKCVKIDQCGGGGGHNIPDTVHCPVNEENSDCVIPCNDCKIKGNCKSFVCKKGCDCKKGYFRNLDGKCIREAECPLINELHCPTNEVPSECVVPCNDCKIKGICKSFACKKGCDCKKGYLRNKDGKCIREAECPITNELHCPVNEEPSDCIIPCNDCKIKGHCKSFICKKGCDCKKGYFRNKDGKCVLESECPKITALQPKCGPDEQFYECGPTCKNTCENIFNPNAKCQCGPPCCFCKEGLVKRKDGKCVPYEQCEVKPQPQCGADEEFYECKPSCKNTCNHFFNPRVQCQCAPPGCFCKKGLLKRPDGKCVPPTECRAVKPSMNWACSENAEFTTCGPPCRPTCENPYPAPCAGACVKGCCCKSGYVEDSEGRCVLLQNCKKCSHPNEEYLECGSTCPDTCENRGSHAPGSCPYRCNRGCYCKKGLYRTKLGYCVPLRDCDGGNHSPIVSYPAPKREHTDDHAVKGPECHGCVNKGNCEGLLQVLRKIYRERNKDD